MGGSGHFCLHTSHHVVVVVDGSWFYHFFIVNIYAFHESCNMSCAEPGDELLVTPLQSNALFSLISPNFFFVQLQVFGGGHFFPCWANRAIDIGLVLEESVHKL